MDAEALAILGDFRERFSTCLHPCSPVSHLVLRGMTSPQRGEARWGVVPQAAVRGEDTVSVFPPPTSPR